MLTGPGRFDVCQLIAILIRDGLICGECFGIGVCDLSLYLQGFFFGKLDDILFLEVCNVMGSVEKENIAGCSYF